MAIVDRAGRNLPTDRTATRARATNHDAALEKYGFIRTDERGRTLVTVNLRNRGLVTV